MFKALAIPAKLYFELRLLKVRSIPWLLDKINKHDYHYLSEVELQATRKSNTLFIFGSGYSINNISSDEWRHFEQHDTLSFNFFMYQDKVRIDYHLIREIGNQNDLDPAMWKPQLSTYADLLHNNSLYSQSIFLVQGGWKAINGNRLLGMKILRKAAKVFRFHNSYRGNHYLPTSSLSQGLVHGAGTLTDCINFAYLLGWKKIVLVGVDLYDRRYFWLGKDEVRNDDPAGNNVLHKTTDGVISCLRNWCNFFSKQGVELYVYNPRSLLTEIMPVYCLEP